MKTSKLNQVGNFEKLVSFINAQGAVYNPGKASIKSAALQTLLTQAQGQIQAADVSRTAYENAINARQLVSATIPKLATRIIAALKGSGAPSEAIDDCMTIRRRFNAQAKKTVDRSPVPSTSPDGNATIPVFQRKISQLDMDSMIGNFHRLVIRATSEPLYKPNELDLQSTALNAFVTTLRARNNAVVTTFVAMKEASLTLNKVLYDSTGIYGQASAAKAYVLSVFGFRSGKHREVSSLEFRKK